MDNLAKVRAELDRRIRSTHWVERDTCKELLSFIDSLTGEKNETL
jgi:hypothetical protein